MHQGDYPIPPQHQPQPPSQQPYYHQQQQQQYPQTPYHPPNPPVPPSLISLPGAATNASASAPPFSPSPSDYPNYPSFPHHYPDPTPHTTPFYPPQPPQTTPYYPPYDPHPNPNLVSFPTPYDPAPNYDPAPAYFDDNSTGYATFGPTRATLGGVAYDYSKDNGSTRSNYGGGSYEYNDGLSSRSSYGGGSYEYGKDDGVYAYEGKSEPYGARGTGSSSFKSKSSDWSGLFDDYGRAISFPKDEEKKSSGGDRYSGSGSGSGALKVVRAVPKAEDKNDGKSGVQKYRVKLLAESGGQSSMDVLCMVGLDGIRMLDPTTSRTLRIYPLENVTRCDKIDSSTFAFWSKTSVDVEPRRIRLQSNSYTTNTILDTVTAATVQFKEMGGRSRPSESPKAVDLASEKKKGLGDWINKLKPLNEEKDYWVPDEAVSKCTGCGSDFSAFNRRHHCRNCGDVFCDKCTQGRTPLTSEENAQPVRVCDRCMAEVTHRLSKAKEAAGRPVTLQSHEELAKKLQEEMEKNLRISSGSKSEGSGKRMKEVACPTCTVHLQVQVPSSGSETIECGVCQHPFIVSAN